MACERADRNRVESLLWQKSETGRLWDFERSIVHGPKKHGLAELTSSLEYWKDMRKKVERKAKAGFSTSFTDYWGLGLSQQLINAPDGGSSMETPFSKRQG